MRYFTSKRNVPLEIESADLFPDSGLLGTSATQHRANGRVSLFKHSDDVDEDIVSLECDQRTATEHISCAFRRRVGFDCGGVNARRYDPGRTFGVIAKELICQKIRQRNQLLLLNPCQACVRIYSAGVLT